MTDLIRAIGWACLAATLGAGCRWIDPRPAPANTWTGQAQAALRVAATDRRVHRVEVGEADLVVFRPTRVGLIDASGAPLQDALVRAVRDDDWAVAINASFIRIHPPDVGHTRGAVWLRDILVDPPEAGSDALSTLEVTNTERGLSLDGHPGDPASSVPGRVLALGGLEPLVVAGVPTASPTFKNQLQRFGAERSDVGRTYLAWRTLDGVVGVFVCDSGARGPALGEVPQALASLGFDSVWMLDGGPSSSLVLREDGAVHVRAESEPPAGMNLRFGLAFAP